MQGLKLSNDSKFYIESGAKIELPAFMFVLDQESVDSITNQNEKSHRLIAIGFDRGELIMMTGSGEFKKIERFEMDVRGLRLELNKDGDSVLVFNHENQLAATMNVYLLLKRAKDMGLVIGNKDAVTPIT